MSIQIIIKNNQITLKLKTEKRVLDVCEFPADQNLSGLLLIRIDALLLKNKLTPSDVAKYYLQSDIAENYTTYRIAKSVINALNWGYLREF